MSCDSKDVEPIVAINQWMSAINLAVKLRNPAAGFVTGQFAIATQSGATSVALSDGTGTAPTAIPGVSINAPTMAWFAKVGGWIAITAKAAGVVVPGVGLVSIGMTLISAAAAAAANKTFREIVTDPSFWDSIGDGTTNEYLKSSYDLAAKDLTSALKDALLTGEMHLPKHCPKDFNSAVNWSPPRDPLILAVRRERKLYSKEQGYLRQKRIEDGFNKTSHRQYATLAQCSEQQLVVVWRGQS